MSDKTWMRLVTLARDYRTRTLQGRLLWSGLSVSCILVALTIGSWNGETPVIAFALFLPIFISAFVGGIGGGFSAVVLAVLGTDLFLLQPHYFWVHGRSAEQLDFLLLVAVVGLFGMLAGSLIADRLEGKGFVDRVFGMIPECLVVVRLADRVVVRVNDATAKLWGTEISDIIGRPVTDFTAWLNVTQDQQIMAELELCGRVSDYETNVKLTDGRVIPLSISSQIVSYAGNRCVLSVLRDVTDARRAASATEAYAAIVTSSDDAIIGKDLRGIITSWNAGAEQLFGYRANEVIGESILKIIPDERRDEEADILALVKKGQRVHHFETVRLCKDARRIEISVTVSPIRDHLGNVVGASKIARDIGDRRRSEEAIKASEERYRTLFHYAPEGILVLNRSGKFLDANRGALAMLQCTREELADLTSGTQLIAKEYFSPGHGDAKTAEVGDCHAEQLLERSDGSTFLADVIVTPMPGGNLLVIMRDLTFEKQSEDALKLKEEQLHASDRRLAEIMQGMSEACFAIDSNWQFTFVNTRCESALGRKRDEIIGKFIWEVFENWVGSLAEINYGRAMADRVSVTFEFFSPISQSWMEARLFPSSDGIASFLLDISARKALEDEKEKLFQVIEHSRDFIGMADLDGQMLYLNSGARTMLGLDENVVLGEVRFSDYLPQSWLEVHRNTELAATLSTGAWEGEMQVKNIRSGAVIDVHRSTFLLRNDRGSPSSIATVTRDITANKRAEAALRESEARFRRLIENAMDLISVVSEAGVVTYQSPSTYRLLGYAPEEIRGRLFADLLHPEDAVRTMEEIQHALRDSLGLSPIEFRLRSKEGVYRIFEAVGRGMVEGIKERSVVLNSRDVTDTRRLEDQFRQAQKMEAIGTLAGGIAHDFNNILTGIVGYTEFAMMEVQDSNTREELESVMQAAGRATELVRQILTFSRRQEQQRHPLKLNQIVAEALKLLRASIPSLIEFESELEETPPILADSTQIHQIVMNLCTNAAHAMRDKPGRLSVSLRQSHVDEAVTHSSLRSGEYVLLKVQDTGHGMNAETLGRIFEPFFTTKGPGEGTGLGLAAVHGIVASHEGAITVVSEEGKGTTFSLFFPVYLGDAEKISAATRDGFKGAGEKVLYIDDELPLARLGKKILESQGYSVEAMTKPVDALELVRRSPAAFDLVVTDLMMPKMSGMELARAISDVRSDLPIILMTGHTASLTTETMEAAGIRQLLLKPFSQLSLGTAVHTVLQRAKVP